MRTWHDAPGHAGRLLACKGAPGEVLGLCDRIMSGGRVRPLTERMRRHVAGILRVFPEVPPRVEYSLTETGQTLQPVIEVMKDWGIQYKAAHAA